MATITVPQRTIPGPRALPLLGWRANMLRLYVNPFAYLRRLYDTYGDVVALAQGDPSNVLAFGSALNFRLLANPDFFEVSAGPWLRLPKDTALGRLIWNNLPLMNGEKHRQHRRLMQPAFHTQELKVVLAMLLQRYRLAVVPNARITPNISMRPTHGMPMRIFPQDRQFQRVPVRGAIHDMIDFA